MKNIKIKSAGFLLTAFFAIVTFANVNIFAQKKESQKTKVFIEEYSLSDNAVKSLINGIKSENEGLRKNAIFLAGEYKLNATIDCLIEALQKEKDLETKILIVLSLHKIGDPIAIDFIKEIVKAEQNKNAKKMFAAINSDFPFSGSIVSLEK